MIDIATHDFGEVRTAIDMCEGEFANELRAHYRDATWFNLFGLDERWHLDAFVARTEAMIDLLVMSLYGEEYTVLHLVKLPTLRRIRHIYGEYQGTQHRFMNLIGERMQACGFRIEVYPRDEHGGMFWLERVV